MIRTFVRGALLVAAVTAAGAAPALAQTPKLGIVNSQALLSQAPGTAAAMAAFEQALQGYEQEIIGLENELQALQDSLDRQGATLTAAVRQQRAEEIQQKYVAYQIRQQELDEEAQMTRNNLVGPIVQQIETIVEQVRTEGGYAIIFDVASGPTVFAADPALDVTQEVLNRLREAPAVSTPATP